MCNLVHSLHLIKFKILVNLAKSAIIADIRHFVTGIAEKAQAAADNRDSMEFCANIRHLLPLKSSSFPMWSLDGVVASTPKESWLFVQSHFASLTHAVVVDSSTLIEAADKKLANAEQTSAPCNTEQLAQFS